MAAPIRMVVAVLRVDERKELKALSRREDARDQKLPIVSRSCTQLVDHTYCIGQNKIPAVKGHVVSGGDEWVLHEEVRCISQTSHHSCLLF